MKEPIVPTRNVRRIKELNKALDDDLINPVMFDADDCDDFDGLMATIVAMLNDDEIVEVIVNDTLWYFLTFGESESF